MERKRTRRIKRTIKKTNDDGEEVEEVVEEVIEEIVEPEDEFFLDEDEINPRDDTPTDVDLTEELLKPEHPHIENDNQVNQSATIQEEEIDEDYEENAESFLNTKQATAFWCMRIMQCRMYTIIWLLLE